MIKKKTSLNERNTLLVDWYEQNGECDAGEESQADLLIQQKQRHADLHRQTPELVKTRSEVDNPIGVGAHKVHHFSCAELRYTDSVDFECLPVCARNERRANFQTDQRDAIVKVRLQQGAKQC